MDTERRKFIFCYDYGMGGLWGYISAPSRAAVTAAYPELSVFDEPPSWLTSETLSAFVDEDHDLDGAPWGVLNTVLEARAAGRSSPRKDWPVFLVGEGDPDTGEGRWLFVRAPSLPDLLSRYPELVAVHGKRDWSVAAVREGSIENEATYVDAEPAGLLAEIVDRRAIGK